MPNRKTDEVLAAIDGALSDWSISADAMRWSPEPHQIAADPPIYGDEPGGFPVIPTERRTQPWTTGPGRRVVLGSGYVARPIPDGYDTVEIRTMSTPLDAGTPIAEIRRLSTHADGLVVDYRPLAAPPPDLARVWHDLIAAVTPLVEEFARAFERVQRILADAGLPTARPLARALDRARPPTAEEIAARALDLRHTRHTGPPIPGPEQRPRPRRHA
jgi:hypothetical protein